MATTASKKQNNSVVLEQIIIVILLVAIVTIGLFATYRYLVREEPMTPDEKNIKQLESTLDSNPGDKQARLRLAYSYQRNGDLDRAVNEYQEVLKMDPKELAALYNLGVIAKQNKDNQAAEQYLKKVLEIKKEHVLGGIALGELYLEQGKYDQAIKVVDYSIKIQPYLARTRIIKAQALEKKGDKNGAAKEYKEVLRFIPDHEEALSGLQRLK